MDARTGKVTGEEHVLRASVAYDALYSSGAYSVSKDGILLYQDGGAAGGAELQWTRADGKPLGKLGSPAVYSSVRVAPDDKRVAVNLVQSSGVDIWVFDLIRDATMRLTSSSRVNSSSMGWSPDGRSIVYSGNTGTGNLQIFQRSTDGTGEERKIAAFSDRDEWVTDWSSDGHYILFYALDPVTRLDVWAVPVDGSQKPIPVARGPHDEINGRFSPDGRWVAYVSNESGRNEIYLVPFRHGQGKWHVAAGIDIAWSRDGRTLYYTSGQDDIWAVPVAARGDTVELGTPQHIFNTPIRIVVNGSFDVTRDGRFLTLSSGEPADVPMTLVLNWKTLLNHEVR
jgi:Tol biopolymer transport system component